MLVAERDLRLSLQLRLSDGQVSATAKRWLCDGIVSNYGNLSRQIAVPLSSPPRAAGSGKDGQAKDMVSLDTISVGAIAGVAMRVAGGAGLSLPRLPALLPLFHSLTRQDQPIFLRTTAKLPMPPFILTVWYNFRIYQAQLLLFFVLGVIVAILLYPSKVLCNRIFLFRFRFWRDPVATYCRLAYLRNCAARSFPRGDSDNALPADTDSS